MTTGIVSLPLRASPTSRRVLHKSMQLSHVHVPSDFAHTAVGSMLNRASQKFQDATSAPRSRPPVLAKQLFPSSSPASSIGDIRDQFKKSNSTSSAVASASVSARTALDDRSVNLAQNGASRTVASNGSIASLYSAHSKSFKSKPACIDLTEPVCSAKKVHEPVYFAEEDFSDDDALDLDFEAPVALPQQLKPPAPQALPPPATPAQRDTAIPWSSSPASHFLPPNPRRTPSTTSSTSHSSLKRESSGHVEVVDPSTQKKAKKRVLPASFCRDEAAEEDDKCLPEALRTPAQKTKALWDSSASAIKEQKKLLKSQKNSRNLEPEQDAVPESMHEVEAKASKSVAISLSSEQAHVVDMVVNQNQSVFFTGPAGAGKSVLMRAIINELKRKYARDPERVAVTASTGLAACNIGGITLHSFSGIGLGKEEASALVRKIRRNPKAKNRWLRTKCLIIDEISMVDGDLFDKLSQIGRTIRNNGRPWGGIQLIITGDFFQLPPVPDADKKRESKFAFDAATWTTSIDHTIGLTQIFRQRDPEFARMLNEMRVGKISDHTVQAFKALARPLNFDDGVDLAELYPTRAQVEGSNEKRLRELPGQIHRYEALDSGDPALRDRLLTNMMAPRALELKIGAQVMLIKNLDETLVNGSLGKVIAFSDEKTFEMGGNNAYDEMMEDSMAKAKRKLQAFSRDSESASSSQQYPVVQFISTGGVPRVILCQPEEWKVELPSGEVQAKRNQLPLILAWALSIHKAQGQTLERVTVNLGRVFEKGQAYVALSRATSQHGLRVLGFERSKVMAHPKVVEFYSKLSSVDDFARKPQTIAEFIAHRKGTTSQPNRSVSHARAENGGLDDDEEAMASYGY
ncbi:DNA helicase PIF1, ATP-dependent [Metarhizium rileyi]|uniref:ATP-dependent DNA helicase PIF1 n=1 Tax=Metarhizium rileyi (strain RCEF 4871) TaxID=1649241 RepID=A0A167F3J3_METRR|nr:DNA helicase PIF1, ATP-dependent [Metarhizium rileyi RCEF 4871]